MVAALTFVLAAQEAEGVKPLEWQSLVLSLVVIVIVSAAVMLAGLGYFSPSKGN